jgi:hypothetical protein
MIVVAIVELSVMSMTGSDHHVPGVTGWLPAGCVANNLVELLERVAWHVEQQYRLEMRE